MSREYKETVAVIIPLFNSEKFMEKTINSVINQTYQNFEMILVDDCSKDETRRVAENYEKKYGNVHYFCLEQNSGAAVARNRGLEVTDARYVAFLDSDDTWECNKLEKQLNFMKKNNYAFTFSAYDTVNDDGDKIGKKIRIKEKIEYKDLLSKTMIATPTVLIDRKKTGDLFMPLRRTGQDYAFWLLLLRNTDAYGIDEPIVHVCKRKNSLSKNKFQNIRDVWDVQTKYENINVFFASINIFRYCFYTLKKHYLG